jgi:AraC-like DNA-binding protein
MELFRKYFSEEQLRTLLVDQPDWGVNVRTVGHYIHKPKATYPDPKHPNSYYFDWKNGRVLDEFQLIYIPNGQGTFEAEGVKETPIQPGAVFLLFPGVWHRYHPSEDTGWEEFWVGFRGHYADYLMKQNCFRPSAPIIQIGFHAELLNVFIQLIETVKYEGVAYRQLSSCLVTQLLGLVYSTAIMTNESRQNKNKIIHVARFRMHENLYNNMDMENLAMELNVSYPWFRRAFKETIGTAPGQYHLQIRIDKACKLLRETELTVTEISQHLGFESEFYFSRIFKKKMGLPPGQHRIKD